MKICALGEEAVGKTSLIRRYVADKFEGPYTRTIGTLLSKKTVKLEEPEGKPVKVDAAIWDIMGRRSFPDLLQGAYFHRAQGAFAVCDLTRRDTMEALQVGSLRSRVQSVTFLRSSWQTSRISSREVRSARRT
ncbi:MAG: hypothetical protein V3U17_07105 [Thermoplasmata archaeon]